MTHRGIAVVGVLLAIMAGGPGAGAQEEPDVHRFVGNAEFPTSLEFAPDGRLFYTEKDTGRVRIVEDGELLDEPFVTVPSRATSLETGLLGLAIHPDFPDEPWVYLYYAGDTHNVLVRVRADGNRGTDTETIFEGLPVSPYHDGGDMTFGPDGKLYLAVGEGHEPGLAQDRGSVGGKMLRLNPDGTVPGDNPFGGDSPVYSMGHRNSFGICFDPETGNLWETENGPQGDDEVNLIRPGENYGWPEVMGPGGGPELVDPAIHFPQTIVPTGCAFYTGGDLGQGSEGALFFGDYQGNLHRAILGEDRTTVQDHSAFVTGLPGITNVQMGPDGRLYLATQESILRLPRTITRPSPDEAPSPEDAPAPEAAPSPEAAPAAAPDGPDERSVLPWIAAAVAAAVLAAGVVVWYRRRSP